MTPDEEFKLISEEEPRMTTMIDVLKKGVEEVEKDLIDMDFDLADIDPIELAQMLDQMIEDAGDGPHVLLIWREYWMVLLGSEDTKPLCGHQLFLSYQRASELMQKEGVFVTGAELYAQDNDSILISTYRDHPVFLLNYEVMEVR